EATVLDRQDHLEDAGRTRRSQGMAEIAFHGTERTIALLVSEFAKRIIQPLNLDRISKARARAVSFGIGDRGGVNIESLIDLALQGCLGNNTGGRHAIGSSIVVDAPGTEASPVFHRKPSRHSLRQRFR